VRSHPVYRDLPVFVLSSSEYEEDQQRASQRGATGYLIKTPEFQNVVRVVSQLICASQKEPQSGRALDILPGGKFGQLEEAPGDRAFPRA
jgi:DNA-binding NarL/FixJ family response regulator